MSKATSDSNDGASRKRPFRWWWVVVALILLEFGVYGSRGHVRVCVGKTGETDFDLDDEPRTDENRWRFPRCEARMNLGLRSRYDGAVDEAVRVACRGATTFRHRGEVEQCRNADAGWLRRIEIAQCYPWHAHYLEHLLWFV